MSNVAIYIRVSSDKSNRENQLPPLLARAPNAVLYEETGSAVRRRPQFERLMQDCRAGRITTVHIWALDRLHRNMAALSNTVLELDKLGVTLVSYRESWLDTASPVRSLLVGVFGWIAEMERAQIIERTRAGQERARREGRHIGRKPVDPKLIDLACEMVRKGHSLRSASRIAGIADKTLRNYLNAESAP